MEDRVEMGRVALAADCVHGHDRLGYRVARTGDSCRGWWASRGVQREATRIGCRAVV